MDWQTAIGLSVQRVAVRLTRDGRVVRRDGVDGIALMVAGGSLAMANSSEAEGFDDWQPLGEVVASRSASERMRGRSSSEVLACFRRTREAQARAMEQGAQRGHAWEAVPRDLLASYESLLSLACSLFVLQANEALSEGARLEVARSNALGWLQELLDMSER